MAKKKALGQGLDALFGDNGNDGGDGTQTLRIADIEPNRSQPRQHFDESAIAELADSIRQHGLIQPIVVRPFGGGYQIVAGERRWRACKMLGKSEVPAIIKDFSDSETAQIALIENVQREDLNPIEEASAYRALMDEYNMTQETLSAAVGKSRSAIANSVRLLNFPEPIVEMIRKRELSAGQAKAIAAAKDEEAMLEIAKAAMDGKMTVRDIEKAVAHIDESPDIADKNEYIKENRQSKNYITEMEISLNNHLGRKVKINSKDGEKGSITIDFYEKAELTEIAEKLTMY